MVSTPNASDGLFEHIEKEDEETCLPLQKTAPRFVQREFPDSILGLVEYRIDKTHWVLHKQLKN